MKGSNTYSERQTVANKGEVLFEQYCKENHYECKRVGFDEKNNAVALFMICLPYYAICQIMS